MTTKPQVTTVKTHTVVIPPGEYWVGDPCYAYTNNSDSLWMPLLCNFLDDSPLAQVGDNWFVAFPTAYGDGVYLDQDGREYGVDAGLIGVVPVDSAEPDAGTLYALHRTTFEREVQMYSEDGKIHIGRLVIDTSGE